MKKLSIIALVLCSIVAHAQSIKISNTYLDAKASGSTKIKPGYFLKSVENIGSTACPEIEEKINRAFGERKTSISPYWHKNALLNPSSSEAEAGVIITAKYIYGAGSGDKSKLTYERSGDPRLPYYKTETSNYADAIVYLHYEYSDGSPAQNDTINKSELCVLGHSKDRTTEELVEKAIRNTGFALSGITHVTTYKSTYFKFPKVKVKDKVLKAEYANINDMLKAGEYIKAGTLLKKIHESSPSEESAIALGQCYEIVGNFPKAEECFSKAPVDFQIKTRMKKKMQLLDYANSIGYEPEFIEF